MPGQVVRGAGLLRKHYCLLAHLPGQMVRWRYIVTFLKAVPVVFLGSHLALALAPPINFPVDKISFLCCTGTASFDTP